jgi:outer membrane protein
MKGLASVFSILSFVGVVILFVLHFSGNKAAKSPTTAPSNNAIAAHIVFVNIDTLEAHYDYLKSKKEDFAKRQEAMQLELQGSAEKMQKD